MTTESKAFLLLFMGFIFLQTGAQEIKHAPTVEQCRADQRLWMGKLEESARDYLPSFGTLADWQGEMRNCESVDPENRPRYYNVLGEIGAEQDMRLEHFLDRHELYDKFIEEDKAGKR